MWLEQKPGPSRTQLLQNDEGREEEEDYTCQNTGWMTRDREQGREKGTPTTFEKS